MPVNPSTILRRLASKFGTADPTSTSGTEEDNVYTALESILEGYIAGKATLAPIEESFDYDDDEIDGCDYEFNDDDPDWVPESAQKKWKPMHEQVNPEKIKKAFELWSVNRSPSKTATALGWKGTAGIERVKQIVYKNKDKSGGSDLYKYQEIRNFVKQRFDEDRSECRIVNRDKFDIWIRAAVSEFKPTRPCTSRSYFEQIKKDLRISSRKITKFVTRKTVQDEEQLIADAKTFVKELNERVLDSFKPDEWVLNMDQSGFGL